MTRSIGHRLQCVRFRRQVSSTGSNEYGANVGCRTDSVYDLLEITASPGKGAIVTGESAKQRARAWATAGDVMRPALTTVEATGHLAAAAYLMRHGGEAALVVIDNEHARRPIGLITDANIAQAVADGKDPNQVRVNDLMTADPTVITASTSIQEAARIMISGRFRHLPVVGEAGVVGIVDIADVCQALLDAYGA